MIHKRNRGPSRALIRQDSDDVEFQSFIPTDLQSYTEIPIRLNPSSKYACTRRRNYCFDLNINRYQLRLSVVEARKRIRGIVSSDTSDDHCVSHFSFFFCSVHQPYDRFTVEQRSRILVTELVRRFTITRSFQRALVKC